MASLPPHFTPRRLLAAGLLIAAVIAAVLVWVNRGTPAATALDNLSGEEVHTLLAQRHDDGDREICGTELTVHIESIGSVPHGLDSTSEVPVEAAALIEEYGAALDDHEQRHFDTHRILLVSWDPTSKALSAERGPQLGSVYELHYLEDETSIGWGVVYSGSVFECPPNWPD